MSALGRRPENVNHRKLSESQGSMTRDGMGVAPVVKRHVPIAALVT